MGVKNYKYVTCCIEARGEDINEMRRSSYQITYRTMLRRCDGLDLWAREHGYNRYYFPLKNDWHVSYHKGLYLSIPCYYLCWSAIEFIWTEDGKCSSPQNKELGHTRTCLLPRMRLGKSNRHIGSVKI